MSTHVFMENWRKYPGIIIIYSTLTSPLKKRFRMSSATILNEIFRAYVLHM